MHNAHEIIGITHNNNFNPIHSIHQSSSSNCGLYVFINALLITYIGIHAPDQINILRNLEIYRHLEKELTKLYYDYYHSLPTESAKDEFAIYFIDSTGNIPNFNKSRSEFVADLREMYTVPILDNYEKQITIEFAGITLDLAELAHHIIVVENSFSKDCLCNNIFINSRNISKMREFYSAKNAIISFIIGNAGHWKLYTINKIGMKHEVDLPSVEYQTIYLDSMGGGPTTQFVQGINSRILQFTKFDEFFAGILECIREEDDININATDNLDFLITYSSSPDLPAINNKYMVELLRKWIAFEDARSADNSYIQSYLRMIMRIRDNVNAPLIRIITQLPEWPDALQRLKELQQSQSLKYGGIIAAPQRKIPSKWIRFILM